MLKRILFFLCVFTGLTLSSGWVFAAIDVDVSEGAQISCGTANRGLCGDVIGGKTTCTTEETPIFQPNQGNNCPASPSPDVGTVCCMPNASVVANDQPMETSASMSQCSEGTMLDARLNLCVPSQTGLSEMSVQQLLLRFLNWLLAIIGFLALLAFLISGAQYLLAFGDDGMIETAKDNMKWSLVGVVVAFGSYVIVQAVGMLF